MKFALFSVVLLAVLVVFHTNAQSYPDMVGRWTGTVRVVSSGDIENDRLDHGGVIINEIELEVWIDAQDGETFIGRSRTSQTAPNNPGAHVWGSIRSTGDEALFITENGGRGHLWFENNSEVEYCLTSLVNVSITSYCARLQKQ